jgi:hypothetical protein
MYEYICACVCVCVCVQSKGDSVSWWDRYNVLSPVREVHTTPSCASIFQPPSWATVVDCRRGSTETIGGSRVPAHHSEVSHQLRRATLTAACTAANSESGQ